MNKDQRKRIGKVAVKSLFLLMIMGVISLPFVSGGLKDPRDPATYRESYITEAFTIESFPMDQTPTFDDVLSSIKEFIDTPEGGVSWDVFGETGQTPYSYTDEEGQEWSGVRPEFSDNLKKLDGTEILVQGYMFPLGQEEKQSLFLLGPFPVSCPFHYHVLPNLIIEAHAKTPVAFSYEAVNIKGQLELVPADDEFNVFYRLKNAELVK